MPYSNMGELKAGIADWLNREDLTSVIPDFISLAQNRINKDVRLRGYDNQYYQAQEVGGFQQKNPITRTQPLAEVQTVIIDGKEIPYVTNEEYFREREYNYTTNGVWTWISGDIHYSRWLDSFSPETPTGDFVLVELIGYDETDADPSVDGISGWAVTDIPEIILYASLVEASIYLRDLQGVELYQARYDELCDKFRKDQKRREVIGGLSVSSIGGDYKFQRTNS